MYSSHYWSRDTHSLTILGLGWLIVGAGGGGRLERVRKGWGGEGNRLERGGEVERPGR